MFADTTNARLKRMTQTTLIVWHTFHSLDCFYQGLKAKYRKLVAHSHQRCHVYHIASGLDGRQSNIEELVPPFETLICLTRKECVPTKKSGQRHRLPLRGNPTPSTAFPSQSQLTLSPPPSFTKPQGKLLPSSLSKISFNIPFLPSPVATKAILMAWVTTGSVRVIRFGGGFGESLMGDTQASASRSNSWLGNRLQVCPSGPQPRSRRSKTGSLTLSLAAKEAMRVS